MKTKHTPGPWTVDGNGIKHSYVGAGRGENGNFEIARTSGPQKKQNAKLIAAAPDLLEALKKAKALMFCYGTGDIKHIDPYTGEILTPVMQQICSAIAKAEGK